jgi:hypothetical protein
MELMLSPIFGLVMVVMNHLTDEVSFSLPREIIEGKTFYKCASYSQVRGDFYGASHLSYRIRSPSHPP